MENGDYILTLSCAIACIPELLVGISNIVREEEQGSAIMTFCDIPMEKNGEY